ncbi:MAG: aspartate kinase [Actinomycetota bacterium]
MALYVQKFGGTSVASPDRIAEVVDHVRRTVQRGDQVVLVVSAMGKETDDLIRLANEVTDVKPGREMDMLITAGERKAVAVVAMALHGAGVPADSFTGSQAGFITDTTHENARILEVKADRVKASLDAGRVPVVAGSQGVSTDKEVTFLGRGGSDTTAVALAHRLEADACELYTDVSGVFTTDPRVVANARKMKHVSFDELLEMTACGCPKPAMRSVEYAHRHGVALHIRSAFTWEQGTWVNDEESMMERAIVTAVVHDMSESKVTITGVPDQPGIAAKLFRPLADADVNVDMIVQNVGSDGATDISFTVPSSQSATAVEVASDLDLGPVTADDSIGKVSVIGAGMKSNPGVAAQMFETLAEADINIQMLSTSGIRISAIVDADKAERAVGVLHEAFELASPVA